MAKVTIATPVVYDSKEGKIRIISNTEVIGSSYIDDVVLGMSVVARVLKELVPGEIPGTLNTPYTDYPNRNNITHNTAANLASNSRRVDNLVTGTVETLGGRWYLGVLTDNTFPDSYEHPIYFYEVDKPAEGTIAVDYFRTVELRNGEIQYHYEGTSYRTSQNNAIRFTSSQSHVTHNSQYALSDPKDPKPTDAVKHIVYFIIRKLAQGEAPQKVITSPANRYVAGEDIHTATENSRFFLY